jgi:hypothetical protein
VIIVDGEALGSILHSALTKTGKPAKSAEKQTGVSTAEEISAAGSPETPQPPAEGESSSGGADSVTTSDTGTRSAGRRRETR